MTLHIHQETFFPTSIYIHDVPNPEVMNQELEKNILKWQQENPKGVKKTNYGGWHSPTTMHNKPEYQQLMAILFNMVQEIFKKEQLEPSVSIGNIWANINPPGAYNKSHNHANALFSGVYYVKVPNNKEATSGYLELFEPRPGPLIIRPRQNDKDLPNVYWKKVSYNPVQGRIIVFPAWLWHEVHTNNTKESRISVSFNFIQR